ncbi:MAG: hypothetical protein FWE90_04135 [Defluviitaleaceae bacterium]|nr:hypothetical protein [Defluviitaleaceae bacterium]
MKKGIGIGSASIVLVFAVLCLTIFSVITYASALADKALSEIEATLVRQYYEADTLAELIVSELLAAEEFPDTVHGIQIVSEWDWDLWMETLSFVCKISDKMELHVVLGIQDENLSILAWRMRDTGGWERDETLNLFDGDSLNLWQGSW